MENKKEIPTPPSSKVNIRTMQSDIKSLQESGGQAPQPYTKEINQEREKESRETEAPKEISFQPSELESNISGYTGPEKPIFQSGASTVPLPPQPKPAPIKEEKPATSIKKGVKNFWIILGGLILVIILGWGGYYLASKLIK